MSIYHSTSRCLLLTELDYTSMRNFYLRNYAFIPIGQTYQKKIGLRIAVFLVDEVLSFENIHNALRLFTISLTKFGENLCRNLKKTKKIDEMYDFFEKIYSTDKH